MNLSDLKLPPAQMRVRWKLAGVLGAIALAFAAIFLSRKTPPQVSSMGFTAVNKCSRNAKVLGPQERNILFVYTNGIITFDSVGAASADSLGALICSMDSTELRVGDVAQFQYNPSAVEIHQNHFAPLTDVGRAVLDVLHMDGFHPFAMSAEDEAAAASLIRIVEGQKKRGAAVIFIAHSRGNLLVQRALQQLKSRPGAICSLGVLSIAPPTSELWFGVTRRAVIVKGKAFEDIMLKLPYLRHDDPTLQTSMSDSLDRSGAKPSDWFLLHSLSSYLSSPESRDAITSGIRDLILHLRSARC